MKNTYHSTQTAMRHRPVSLRSVSALLLLMFCMGLWQPQRLSAQTKVTGQVVAVDGTPIIGASVLVKGATSIGTSTDVNGQFSLQVQPGKTLVVSYLGYQTQEITASGSFNKIILAEATTKVEDVVVVGYGVQKKESVVGAITQIGNDDIVNSGQTNITTAIAGKLSGVLTMQTSGQPGNNDAKIYIRGISSWNGSEPLTLVDGIERSFSDLDPNEIATISVLKDASATAVFGAKGANGVIIVTTRTGVKGKPKMNISVTQGIDIPTKIPDHVSSYTTANALNVARMNTQGFGSIFTQDVINEYRSPSSNINSIRYPDVDWFNLVTRKFASNTNANFNISGGGERASYFFSLGYTHEGSVFKQFADWTNAGFSFDKINYRSNIDFNFTKSTTLSVKVGGDLSVREVPTGTGSTSVGGIFNMMYSSSPMMYPAYYPAWVLDIIPDPDYNNDHEDRLASASGSGAYFDNVYKILNYGSFDQTTANKLYTDVVFEQKLDFITKGLSLKATASMNTYYSRLSQTCTKSYPVFYINWDTYDSPEGGNPWVDSRSTATIYEDVPYSVSQGGLQSGYYMTFYWEGSVNYDRTFNKRHNVTALALFNQREYSKGVAFPYRNQGVVGRVTYNFDHRFLFEANLGYTGSEQFAPSNRYGIFPSVAIGYNLSQEKFWQRAMPWWSRMKVRYSDGLVGNDQAGERWLYQSSYDRNGSYIFEGTAANLVAQWEEARKRDLGIEMGFIDDRITLTVDLFDEFRSKMLVAPNVTMLVGANYKNVNRGEMKKHGIDVELGYHGKTQSGFRYDITGMLGFNENRIVNYEDAPYAPEYQKTAGKAYKAQTSGVNVVDSGYYTSVDDIHNYPAYTTNWQFVNVGAYKYLDYSADGQLNVDDLHAIYGSQYPPIVYSLGGTFRYKGFEARFLFYGNQGKYVEYNKSFEIEFNKGDYRIGNSQLDYWTPNNPDANHATLVYGGTSGHPMYIWAGGSGDAGVEMMLEGRTWRKADYLSLREVYLGYTFNTKKIKKKLGVDNLSFYLTGNNLWMVTNLLEGNPESTTFTSGFYPQMTSIKLGLKVGF